MARWKSAHAARNRGDHTKAISSRVSFERLESRELLSATHVPLVARPRIAPPPIPQNIDLSQMRQNQSEGAIAIDPNNPNRIFAASNIEFDDGLSTAYSANGGATWSTHIIANGSDGLIPALSDPSVAFDNFGNLYVGYVNSTTDAAVIAYSTDGGQTFNRLVRFRGSVDQPTVTAANGQVWFTFQLNNRIVATGAPVSGLGQVGKFILPKYIPGGTGGNFGDIAVGPAGQIMVTYLQPIQDGVKTNVYVSVDPDGFGSAGFSKPILAATTNTYPFESIPAQSRGTIDAEPGLAFDRSGGVANGRVYLVYTSMNRRSRTPGDTNVMLRWSGDNGRTWSTPIRVNDDKTFNSQFLPRIAVDQTTGHVAMSWHDCRNDTGAGAGSVDRLPNDDAQLWGVLGQPTADGLTLTPNFQISAGTSAASRARNEIDYGDYTGLTFQSGTMMPIWADNSNSTGNNPAGRWRTFDIYTAKIQDVLT